MSNAEPRTVDTLLAGNEALIARIRLCFGVDHPTFARDVLPLIHAYANYVGWLPATPADHFDRPGGLFQLGLQTGFFSVQGTDAYIFSGRQTISARRQLEPRWRMATFVAGLCGELHRVLVALEVVDDAGATWPPLLSPLSSWLDARGNAPCHVRWRVPATEARSTGLLVLLHVVPNALLQHLAEDNDLIVPHMLASIGGLPLFRGHNVLDDLVRRSTALVVERDLRAHGKPTSGPANASHQTRYLVDGLQRLVATDSAWRPNEDKSRVWYARDGLYLVWPGAARDLCRLLEGEQIAGMPDAADDILSRLLNADLLRKTAEDEPIWHIRPPGASAALAAVKLVSPALLLNGLGGTVLPLDDPLAPVRSDSSRPLHPQSDGEQLPLIAAADAETPRAPPTPSDGAPTPTARWELNAPLRLSAGVRHALAAILVESSEQVVPLEDGHALFLPLHLFDAHGIAPAIAIRALSELGMLLLDAPHALPTVKRLDAAGADVIGIRLKRKFTEPADSSGPLALAAQPTC
ncbi:TraI domain-containing protein [Luteimonas sp. BDR2-5]|uniref:MobH family relaxase n=1 Tax=Proluteimonas luteida TaxID=2878685 RepID=UPI001E61C027|nr:MobH family relaxase [Luteimonas sp. BDR2-5]MCD9026747.1 TraI domain-containing protein [Luteimonas sp. BDR2-5]